MSMPSACFACPCAQEVRVLNRQKGVSGGSDLYSDLSSLLRRELGASRLGAKLSLPHGHQNLHQGMLQGHVV